nr:exodeoxyribonuclease VII large subunit [Hufsiella ginkgonis]
MPEVLSSIQRTIADRYKSTFWVKAELHKLNHYSHSGHCYPEMVEKRDGRVIAQMKAVLWKNDFREINGRFMKILHEPLKDGITILFCAAITFDPVHGLSLRITDIDPVFSLGELERERLETVTRLTVEGILRRNQSLRFPLLPQRIAVISVETSKGYSDFLKVINYNSWGYRFYCHLFPALLQGDRSPDSIIAQLRRIKKAAAHFDVVALIRGGGADVGLSSYNNYALAREIALFPLPVITGIGHSTNETVAEQISFRNAITPTELADFLLQQFHNFSVPVQRAGQVIADRARRVLDDENVQFAHTTRYFRLAAIRLLAGRSTVIDQLSEGLSRQCRFILSRERDQVAGLGDALKENAAEHFAAQARELSGLEKNVRIMDPANVLKRGYSITFVNGKIATGVAGLEEGDQLLTQLADGTVTSTVQQAKANNHE